MKTWKSKVVSKPSIWVSEIKLKDCDSKRGVKIKKLIKLLGGADEDLS